LSKPTIIHLIGCGDLSYYFAPKLIRNNWLREFHLYDKQLLKVEDYKRGLFTKHSCLNRRSKVIALDHQIRGTVPKYPLKELKIFHHHTFVKNTSHMNGLIIDCTDTKCKMRLKSDIRFSYDDDILVVDSRQGKYYKNDEEDRDYINRGTPKQLQKISECMNECIKNEEYINKQLCLHQYKHSTDSMSMIQGDYYLKKDDLYRSDIFQQKKTIKIKDRTKPCMILEKCIPYNNHQQKEVTSILNEIYNSNRKKEIVCVKYGINQNRNLEIIPLPNAS